MVSRTGSSVVATGGRTANDAVLATHLRRPLPRRQCLYGACQPPATLLVGIVGPGDLLEQHQLDLERELLGIVDVHRRT